MLTATASDHDGDSLLFAWEQFDLGNPSPPNTDDGSRPIFRSIIHPDPTRTFPRMGDLLNGPGGFFESLPTTNRTMNFRVTARDNRSGGGGVNSASTQVQVTTSMGHLPYPACGLERSGYRVASKTVTWNVANTQMHRVNCASVSILSLPRRRFYPIVLRLDTPNDGSETITLPGSKNSPARVWWARGHFLQHFTAFSILGAVDTNRFLQSAVFLQVAAVRSRASR